MIQLHDQGFSQREIVTETGGSAGTVSRIIKAMHQNGHGHVTVTHVDVQNGASPETPVPPPSDTKIAQGKNVSPSHVDVRNRTPYEKYVAPQSSEPEPDHDTFFKLFDISTCFYGKQPLSPSQISRYTGIDESEVCEILDDWYQKVVLSPGIGDKYWMSERDKKNLWDKILGPAFNELGENFPRAKNLVSAVRF